MAMESQSSGFYSLGGCNMVYQYTVIANVSKEVWKHAPPPPPPPPPDDSSQIVWAEHSIFTVPDSHALLSMDIDSCWYIWEIQREEAECCECSTRGSWCSLPHCKYPGLHICMHVVSGDTRQSSPHSLHVIRWLEGACVLEGAKTISNWI